MRGRAKKEKEAKASKDKKVASVGKSDAAADASKPPPLRDAFMALPHAERLALQFNLTWAGDYRGLADGEFSDKLAEAMKDYQKRNKFKVTGLLTPEERTLASEADDASFRVQLKELSMVEIVGAHGGCSLVRIEGDGTSF